MMTHGPDWFGPRAQARDRRASRLTEEKRQMQCDTFCIACALLLIVVGDLCADWLRSGGPMP